MRIDIWGWKREATRGDHREFLSLFETADRLGFGGAWFNEFRFQDPPNPYPSTLLLAAAIFARTERLRVGTAVLVLPLYEPHLLAEDIAQLDFQSGGRVDIGVGRGTTPEPFARIGIGKEAIRERFETGCDVLLKTWSDLGTVQRPHPPLYIAGATRQTIGFAASRDLPLMLSLEPDEANQMAIYNEILSETGAASALPRSSPARYVAIGATPEKARETADRQLSLLIERQTAMAAARGAAAPSASREQRLARQFIAGTPEQCIEQIEALRARLGVSSLRCVFNGNGSLDNETAVAAMTLFADEVLPVVSR